MDEFRFYYDESEHSQKITKTTFNASNYYDNFVAVSVGWSLHNETEMEKRHSAFEIRHQKRKSGGELKSTTVKFSEFEHGFASLSRNNSVLINDFFDLFEDTVHINFSVISKIEYIVLQLFKRYENSIFVDMDSMRYSIVKSIIVYKPVEVIEAMFSKPSELVRALKQFYKERIAKNQSNAELKQNENSSFEQILMLLDEVNEDFNINWEYRIAFNGLIEYTQEKGIHTFSLFIDRVGQDGTMLGFARSAGIRNVKEVDSRDFFGIRVADMLAGIISKLLKALHKGLEYQNLSEQLKKKLLSPKWFTLDEERLLLYKKFAHILLEINPAWYKSYAGCYADDLISLNSLLNYMNSFDSLAKFNEVTPKRHSEFFNSYVCNNLSQHFERMRSKLPVDFADKNNSDYLINRRGAKVYYDITKNPILDLQDGIIKLCVLSVGFTQEMIPVATVEHPHGAVCYRLPADLGEWATTCVGFANLGEILFPSYVEFNTINGKHHADIL